MELSQYNEITQKLLGMFGDGTDQGEASNLLADLTTAFSEEVSAKNTANAKVTQLTDANTKLKEDNMRLFLRVTIPEEKQESYNPSRPENSTDVIDALFSDKDGLKIV